MDAKEREYALSKIVSEMIYFEMTIEEVDAALKAEKEYREKESIAFEQLNADIVINMKKVLDQLPGLTEEVLKRRIREML